VLSEARNEEENEKKHSASLTATHRNRLYLSVNCLSTGSSLHIIPIFCSNQLPHVARIRTKGLFFHYYFQLLVRLDTREKNTNCRDTKDIRTKVMITMLILETRVRQIEGKCAVLKLYILQVYIYIYIYIYIYRYRFYFFSNL